MFFQPARHCGTLLTGKVNAERHFFAVGPPQQPASLPALGFDEPDVQACKRENQPRAIECESEGNREDHHRKGAENEKPAARREGIVASCNEREIRCVLHRFAVRAESRFCMPLRRATRHKPVAF